ncbi:putative MHC class I antigen protein [Naja naja]|nr:putative MHC class I antigen protein [Naja naja]
MAMWKTFLTFDKETLTWVASDPIGQITKRIYGDSIPGYNQGLKSYLEKKCIECLEEYLSYGKEMLPRTALEGLRVNSGSAVSAEPPVVTVRGKTEVEDGMETHVCRLDGFYPREIDASWTRDGEVWLEETFHGSVAPNADGTYHYWLSIRIDPKERDRYRCHVEHDGLQEPLDLALEEPTNSKSSLGLIIGCVVAALGLVCVIAGILVFFSNYLFLRGGFDQRAAEKDLNLPPLPVAAAASSNSPPSLLEATGASSHSLKYLATGIGKPGQGLPHFVSVGFVDNHISSYNSNSQKEQPRVSCIKKVGKKDHEYWKRNNKTLHRANKAFRDDLESRNNQSEGE